MRNHTYVRLLEDIGRKDFSLVGGKGANLGEMIAADLPVPEGFVVLTNAYKRFIDENKLEEKIENLVSNLNDDDYEQIQETSKKIKELFEAGDIPKDVLSEINNIYETLEKPAVAVRSSATAEDLPGTSFAGQYNTYLNVRGKDELYKYIKKCWVSLWNSRALSYRLKQKIGNKDLAHGVVVQKLINAEKSGILFTASPVNGRRDQMLLNSSWGLGEAIVGGEVTPDQWVIDKVKKGIVEEKIAVKEVMTVRQEKGIEFVKVPKSIQEKTTLNHQEVLALLELGEKVEKYFASPQDIEWAYLEGKFYLVQSRPITSLYPMPEVRNNKKGLRVFINFNNYSQAMKEPFTPMGGDVIKSMIHRLITKFGKKNYKGDRLWFYQIIGGRMFIDITDFMRKEKSWDKFKKEDPNDKDPITTKALLQLVEKNRGEILNAKEAVSYASMINLRLVKYLAGVGIKYRYGKKNPVEARKRALSISEATINELKEVSKKLVSTEEKLNFIQNNVSDIILNCVNLLSYVSVSATYLQKSKSIMKENLNDISDLYYVEKSVPYSVTTEMGMEILNIAKTFAQKKVKPKISDQEISTFMEKYGHRSSIELDVGVPTWKEEPQYVLDLINSYIDNNNYQEGIDRFYQGKEEARAAIKRIKISLEEKGQNKKARKVEKMLKDFREMFGIRELSKFVITGVLSILRDMLIEVGEELKDQGRINNKLDVFYLTMEDIRSDKNLKEVIEDNKEIFNRNSNLVPPRLLTSTGESIYSAIEEVDENSLLGIPVSPGVYEGKVKVLVNPEEGHKLEKGDILVTTGTNPAWTPLFLKIGALIMETGGPISHGSVVAREYGVPAIAGVSQITTKLKDGQKVRINGETGSLQILSPVQ